MIEVFLKRLAETLDQRHIPYMIIGGQAVLIPLHRYASAEDLVIHKVFAGRAIDVEEARAVVLRQDERLGKAYIRRWLRSFGEAAVLGRDLLAVWRQISRRGQR